LLFYFYSVGINHIRFIIHHRSNIIHSLRLCVLRTALYHRMPHETLEGLSSLLGERIGFLITAHNASVLAFGCWLGCIIIYQFLYFFLFYNFFNYLIRSLLNLYTSILSLRIYLLYLVFPIFAVLEFALDGKDYLLWEVELLPAILTEF